jgi:Tfp pilus assembly protein PilO
VIWTRLKRADRSIFLRIDCAGVAACLLLSGAGYLVGVRPLLAVREQRVVQQQSLRTAVEQASSLVTSTRALRAQLTNAQNALAKIEIALQPATSINERVAELTALAGECHIEMQAIQPGTISNGNRFAQIPIQISANGTYRSAAQFLHRLRERFPDTAVHTFEMAATPEDPTATASINVQLLWYVQPARGERSQKD